MKLRLVLLAVTLLQATAFGVDAAAVRQIRIRDVASVEGIRENPLIGYGLVVGLNGTGDRRQTLFTTQMLANTLQKLGTQIAAGSVRVNNVAAVFVTAKMPAFAHSGTQIDVTVSSIGDAKSLEGGLLLLTPLRAANGEVYVSAQGAVSLGGYSAGSTGNSKQVNHPTVGRVTNGGIVEKEFAFNLQSSPSIALLLKLSDFSLAKSVAEAVNRDLGRAAAEIRDPRRIEIDVRRSGMDSPASLIARIEDLTVPTRSYARVVVNERTGTVVLGHDVRLGAVSILHGSLSIEITTEFKVSQPESLSSGTTTSIAQPAIRAQEAPTRKIELQEGATVEQLVSGLQALGATARDVIAILQAIKAAGALQADLEVL